MARIPEGEPIKRRRNKQNPSFTPDGKLTNWGLALRQIEAVRADRFINIGPFGAGMHQALESPRGQQISKHVADEASRAGLLREPSHEEREEARYREFAERQRKQFSPQDKDLRAR